MGTLSLTMNTDRLVLALHHAGISKTALAEMAGCHRNTIYNIVDGAMADLKTISALTSALNVALAEAGHPTLDPFALLMAVEMEREPA